MTSRTLAVLLISLATTAGCNPTIDVGGAYCYKDGAAPDASTVQGSVSVTFSVSGIFEQSSESLVPDTFEIVGNEVSLSAGQLTMMQQLSLHLWSAAGTGSFHCEDPATAQRTSITFSSDQGLYTTAPRGDIGPPGTCTINVTRYPTLTDPAFEGTFVAYSIGSRFQAEGSLSGSFSVSGVTCRNP